MSTRKPKQIFVEGPIKSAFIAESIEKHSTKTDIGAHSIFLGQVRKDKKDGAEVSAIHYSCYEEMALDCMHQIREEIITKYSLTCMHVYHSLGEIKAGEISLFVFTSSPHRRAAMDAANELVERIKKELPIWGKEVWSGGEEWKKNR